MFDELNEINIFSTVRKLYALSFSCSGSGTFVYFLAGIGQNQVITCSRIRIFWRFRCREQVKNLKIKIFNEMLKDFSLEICAFFRNMGRGVDISLNPEGLAVVCEA